MELPWNWVFEDASHFFFTLQEPPRRPVAPPSTVREIWQAEFDGLYDEGRLMILVLHPQIIGHVSRIRMLAELIRHMKSRPGTWITTAIDIARAARARLGG